jgi:hypothetical protein
VKNATTKPVRCAIYTRVSTEHGLEQDFNSLDAQYGAGTVRRVPAAEVEALVGSAVREHLGDSPKSADRDLIRNHVIRVEIQVRARPHRGDLRNGHKKEGGSEDNCHKQQHPSILAVKCNTGAEDQQNRANHDRSHAYKL